jgi:hypothetical protein
MSLRRNDEKCGLTSADNAIPPNHYFASPRDRQRPQRST